MIRGEHIAECRTAALRFQVGASVKLKLGGFPLKVVRINSEDGTIHCMREGERPWAFCATSLEASNQ